MIISIGKEKAFYKFKHISNKCLSKQELKNPSSPDGKNLQKRQKAYHFSYEIWRAVLLYREYTKKSTSPFYSILKVGPTHGLKKETIYKIKRLLMSKTTIFCGYDCVFKISNKNFISKLFNNEGIWFQDKFIYK